MDRLPESHDGQSSPVGKGRDRGPSRRGGALEDAFEGSGEGESGIASGPWASFPPLIDSPASPVLICTD